MGGKLTFPVVALPPDTVAIVTGANTGIGYETAKYLAMMGAHVILACRSQQRATEAMERMRKEAAEMKAEKKPDTPDFTADLDLEFMQLELASFKSVMEFIEKFKASGRKLQILVCNAGVMPNALETTEDGYEKMFQVNYLSHFLLVAHLLPVMKQSGEDCRIVFVSSEGHKWAGSFDMEQIKGCDPSKFSSFRTYGKSKICQLMHMMTLTSVLKGSHVTVNSVHPGMVATEIGRDFGQSAMFRVMGTVVQTFGMIKNPLEGATTQIDAAVNPKWKGVTGLYLANCKENSMSADARNPAYQQALWEYSLECLQDWLPEDIRQHLQPAST